MLPGKIQNEDIKSEAELVAGGGNETQLPNDTKIWLTSVLKRLDEAVVGNNLYNPIPTVTRLTSGSGTYTTPANVKYLKIKMVGGGGGGTGSGPNGASGGSGGNGGDTTFSVHLGSAIITAGHGFGGSSSGTSTSGGTGGTPVVNAPAITLVSVLGGFGVDGTEFNDVINAPGGMGAPSPFGGTGPGNVSAPAQTNTGSGGGGGSLKGSGGVSAGNIFSGSGGGAGAYVEAIISSPSASYDYSIGAGGSGGSHSTTGYNDGSTGGSGIIIIEEYY